MNWVFRQGSGWLQGPQGNNIFIQLEWMDSGRGWNPTSSGDKYYYYRVLLIQMAWDVCYCALSGWFRKQESASLSSIMLIQFDHGCPSCHPGPQKASKKQKDNGYECISVDLGNGQSKVRGFPRKEPGPDLETYGIVFQFSYHHRFLSVLV